jgi:SAM-dependent methyltransferase
MATRYGTEDIKVIDVIPQALALQVVLAGGARSPVAPRCSVVHAVGPVGPISACLTTPTRRVKLEEHGMSEGVRRFVISHLPGRPARILEVGCGSGELVLDIARRGFEVVGIDPDAPRGASFRKVTLEDFSTSERFDAVVANRSLHHIGDLQSGIDKIHTLLRAGGALILNEFAWDLMDQATAAWYLGHVQKPGPKDESLLPGNFPNAWVAEHDGLHGFEAMRVEVAHRFDEVLFEWAPYIAPYYLERDDLEGEEERLIKSGAIRAIGFRYVGKRA